ncbi:MAG: hypothetical protein EHM33_24435 [Chloroflexi bacterium]|nr:MAG: hypothetical protein EHM33_24435 [Chloroflexota bacterium]
MNKHNVSVPPLTNLSSIASDNSIRLVDQERSRHLIVLIPADSEYATVTRRIWKLANETVSSVQLLGLGKDTGQELALRRDLATMSALIQDAKVSVETKVEIGNNWLEAVKRNYQEGDMIVCIAEQTIGIQRRSLSQILESNFEAPVYILSDLRSPPSQSSVLSQVIAWSGLIGIIAGFFLLQVKILQMPEDGFQTLLLILLLFPEFWLVLYWNSLFS